MCKLSEINEAVNKHLTSMQRSRWNDLLWHLDRTEWEVDYMKLSKMWGIHIKTTVDYLSRFREIGLPVPYSIGNLYRQSDRRAIYGVCQCGVAFNVCAVEGEVLRWCPNCAKVLPFEFRFIHYRVGTDNKPLSALAA